MRDRAGRLHGREVGRGALAPVAASEPVNAIPLSRAVIATLPNAGAVTLSSGSQRRGAYIALSRPVTLPVEMRNEPGENGRIYFYPPQPGMMSPVQQRLSTCTGPATA